MKKLFFIILIIKCHTALLCQCDNTIQYPTTTLGVVCDLNNITNFQYAGDFNLTTGFVDQSYLTFSSSVSTDYITLRKASDNAVIAHGTNPLSILYLASHGAIEMHINTNVSCGVQNVIRSTYVNVACGCNNTLQFPAIIVTISEGVNTISAVQFAGDFNLTTGYQDEAVCNFASSNSGDYLTIRKASDNAILAYGVTPVTIEYQASMGNLEMHINKDNSCGTENEDRISTITHTNSYLCFGGNNDGFAQSSITGVNPSDPISTIYFGGNNDGFAQSSITGLNPSDPIATIYFGGGNDGFDKDIIINLNPNCIDDVIRWSGNISNAWENDGNWDCGLMPSPTDEVIISAFARFQPVVNANDEIKKLIMNNGSSIIINTGVLFLLNGL